MFERERIVLLEKTRARIPEILGIVSALVNFVKLRIDRMLEYLSNRIIFFFFFFARARYLKLEKKIQFHFIEIKCIETRKFNIQRDYTMKSEGYSTSFYLI